MSGKIKLCKPPFFVYHLPIEKYIGVTTNIRARMNKHKSNNNRFTKDFIILKTFNSFDEAINYEYEKQIQYNYKTSNVKNQLGCKNPYAKTVLHTETGVFFDTIKEACECFNYNYSRVRQIIKDKCNKYNLIRI